jgi:hypothetical protein
MTRRLHPALAVAALVTMSAGAHAESLVSSTASLASSTASSASDSLGASSNSSTRTANVAEGAYRVEAVAAVAERPDKRRLTLQHVARAGDDGRVLLDLPAAAAEGLAVGALLDVRQRDYGLAFTREREAAPFFLVLADDVHEGLAARPVRL